MFTETIPLNNHLRTLQTLLEGSISNTASKAGYTIQEGISVSYLMVKTLTVAISGVSCAISASTAYADPTLTLGAMAAVSCTSATSGLVETVSNVAGYDEMESQTGTIGTALDAGSCTFA